MLSGLVVLGLAIYGLMIHGLTWKRPTNSGSELDAVAQSDATVSSSSGSAEPVVEDQGALPLEPGTERIVEIGAGVTRTWSLTAPAGWFVHLRVEQIDADVILLLLDASGRPMLRADRPINDQGVEELLFVAEGDPLTLALRPGEARLAERGTVRLQVEAARPSSAEDRARTVAAKLFYRAEEARWDHDLETARALHTEALEAWRRIGDTAGMAETRDRLGRICGSLGRYAEAESHHAAAAEGFASVGDARWQGISLHFLGWAQFRGRRPDAAIQSFRQALPLRRAIGDRRNEAVTLYALAAAHQLRDETQGALDAYREALQRLGGEEDLPLAARIHHNLGVLYADQGEFDRARRSLESAIGDWRLLGDEYQLAPALNQLGELVLESWQVEGELTPRAAGPGQVPSLNAAAAAFDEALTLRRRAEDARGEASTLANLARLWILRGDVEQGQTLYRAALDILHGSGHPLSEAKVLLGLGEVALEQRRLPEAESRFLEAGELYRGVGDATGEAESLAHLARARQAMGRPHDAERASAQGLELLEDVRPRALAPSLRASFFAMAQSRYDLHVDLLLELHGLEPDGGHDLAAFQAAERARARSLLDLLDARGGQGSSLDLESIRQEEDELIRQIAELDRQRLRHQRMADGSAAADTEQALQGDGGLQATTLEDVERRLSELLDRLDTLHGLRRAANQGGPRGSGSLVSGSVAESNSLATAVADMEEIRRAVRDSGADLMVLRLGRERGVRWTLTESGLETHRLPPRREVESLALRVHGLLSRSHRRETLPALTETLEALSEMLLAEPGAGLRAGDRPLVVVPDGALHYVPFALLTPPAPGSAAGSRWLDRRVVVTVPSVSIWTRLAAQAAVPEAEALPSLAVLADPVFSSDDPRVEVPVAASDGSSGLRRLEASRREAESLVALAPGRTLRLFGFDADKRRVLQGDLAGFDYLHFATHGTLDVEHPELSGIVLSQVDRRGMPRDGILRMLDLFRLDLRARLVVLSACETALGESVRGEGLMGLSRAFFAAGADRLIVSLWRVSDGGTAALMERVYGGIFVEGLDPPAALRRAQLDLARHPDYSAPYFWAGFVAVGAD